MTKKMDKANGRAKKGDDTAALVAKKHGVSPRYVRMVVAGDRSNDDILDDYITLKQGKKFLIDSLHSNRLAAAVDQLVPL